MRPRLTDAHAPARTGVPGRKACARRIACIPGKRNVYLLTTIELNWWGMLAMHRLKALLELDGEGRVTLPESVRAALDVAEGDTLLLVQNSTGGFEIIPETRIPADQRWFYHPEMQERVRDAEADLREGRFVQTRTPGEAEELLKRLKTAPDSYR